MMFGFEQALICGRYRRAALPLSDTIGGPVKLAGAHIKISALVGRPLDLALIEFSP